MILSLPQDREMRNLRYAEERTFKPDLAEVRGVELVNPRSSRGEPPQY